MTLSLCLIVKNEEEHLWRCLESLYKHVDEIIITDTGSSDNTLSIAKKYTNKIYHFEWIDDFSAARNFCQSNATGDYILWMDGDEYFLEDDIVELKKRIILYQNIDFFSIQMRHIRGNSIIWKREEKIKIFKNHKWYKWIWKIHEIIDAVIVSDTDGRWINFEDIGFYHTLTIDWKYWNNIEYFMNHFEDEKNNNTVALFLLEHFLNTWDKVQIRYIIQNISYIHWKFFDFFLSFWKKFEQWGYFEEKKMLHTLLKKSLYIHRKIHFKNL